VRQLVLFLATTLSLCAAYGQPYRHPLLDSLVSRMEGNGTEQNLGLIDKALRMAGAEAEPRLSYFLHRYRCEQLY